jgi:hypothetical protein
MAGTGFHSVVANRAHLCTADCQKENKLTADCLEENNCTRFAMKKIIVPWIATVKSLNLRVECQGFIPVMANRGTLESSLPRGYSCLGKPLNWSAVCHKRVKSSTSHFTATISLIGVPYLLNA